MKKQLFIISSGTILFAVLFFFGRTTPLKKTSSTQANNQLISSLSTEQIVQEAKKRLSLEQTNHLTMLENAVVRGDTKNQQLAVYHQLARFWGDTLQHKMLGAYYLGKSGQLENSEKNLKFAAHLLLEELMASNEPALQKWVGTEAKVLFEKLVQLNPSNDSAKIGIGACYMFGNISDQPMQGISMIREVAAKDPDNMYAQMMLGLGGIKSGQFDKAIERFQTIVNKNPENLEAIFYLAETFDRKGDKQNAVKWYKIALEKIKVPEAKKELEERIRVLNN